MIFLSFIDCMYSSARSITIMLDMIIFCNLSPLITCNCLLFKITAILSIYIAFQYQSNSFVLISILFILFSTNCSSSLILRRYGILFFACLFPTHNFRASVSIAVDGLISPIPKVVLLICSNSFSIFLLNYSFLRKGTLYIFCSICSCPISS